MKQTVTKTDIKYTKDILKSYKQMSLIVEDYNKHIDESIGDPIIHKNQKVIYESTKVIINAIDRAVSLIADDDIREIIEFRFKKGSTRQKTLVEFCLMCERVVDRKTSLGIAFIAKQLKQWGIISESEVIL